MTRFLAAAALALALSVAAVSPSAAQTDDDFVPGWGMMGGGCMMMGMMGPGMRQGMMGRGMMGRGMMGGPDRMGAMVEGRLAYLKGALGITEAQTEAWNGYAEAVKARVEVMQSMRQSMWETMREGGALQRMDARIAAMEAMVEAMKAVKPATDQLYQALTDEQKKAADELIGMDCGAM